MKKNLVLLIAGLLFQITVCLSPVSALEKPGKELLAARIKNVLGKQIDLSLEFTDSKGLTQPLAAHFEPGRPVIIVPGYFDCPRLCGLVFGGVSAVVSEMELVAGQDYKILTTSFDPEDTPAKALAQERQFNQYLNKNGKPPAVASPKVEQQPFWQFLVSDQATINSFLTELGYKYLKDGADYAHSAAIYIVSPDGRISQYFTGIEFRPFDLKLALVEASKGGVGSLLDQALLFCFRYDHIKGKYAWVVESSLKVGGIITILFMVGLFIKLKRAETV